MDSTTTTVGAPPPAGTRPDRRVRHEVRDSLAVMAFSAVTSLAVAAVLTVLVRFGS